MVSKWTNWTRDRDPQAGDDVWIISGEAVEEGKVTNVSEFGAYVQTRFNNHFHPKTRMFYRPQEARSLHHELLEKADCLYNAAKEIEKIIES